VADEQARPHQRKYWKTVLARRREPECSGAERYEVREEEPGANPIRRPSPGRRAEVGSEELTVDVPEMHQGEKSGFRDSAGIAGRRRAGAKAPALAMIFTSF